MLLGLKVKVLQSSVVSMRCVFDEYGGVLQSGVNSHLLFIQRRSLVCSFVCLHTSWLHSHCLFLSDIFLLCLSSLHVSISYGFKIVVSSA